MEREILMMRAPGAPRVVRVRFPLVVGSTPAIVGPKLSNIALSSTLARTSALHAEKRGSTPRRVTTGEWVRKLEHLNNSKNLR